MSEIALILVVVMASYFVVINHVPLRPYNNLSPQRPQLRSTVVGTVPALLVVLAVLKNSGLLIAAGWLWLWLLLQIRQWWIPYLFGATQWHRDWRWYTEGGYLRTFHILKLEGDRPVPDVQHLVLQLLTMLSALAVTLTGLKPVH